MKQATHAWIAVRAMGLIEHDPETAGLFSILRPHIKNAALGAWMPDLADSKLGSGDLDNHVFKMQPVKQPSAFSYPPSPRLLRTSQPSAGEAHRSGNRSSQTRRTSIGRRYQENLSVNSVPSVAKSARLKLYRASLIEIKFYQNELTCRALLEQIRSRRRPSRRSECALRGRLGPGSAPVVRVSLQIALSASNSCPDPDALRAVLDQLSRRNPNAEQAVNSQPAVSPVPEDATLSALGDILTRAARLADAKLK
jgi:hypothetical protein